MRENDGGPAFPTPESHGDDHEGMSLRDYFAAKALQGILSADDSRGSGEPMLQWIVSGADGGEGAHEWIAKRSYELADAMLKARLT